SGAVPMDDVSLDALARLLAGTRSRRDLSRLLRTFTLGGGFRLLDFQPSAAKHHHKKKHKHLTPSPPSPGPPASPTSPPSPPCTPHCEGRVCGEDGCGGTCGPACPDPRVCDQGACVCPSGQHDCQGSCILNGTCCNNADCPIGAACCDGVCTD